MAADAVEGVTEPGVTLAAPFDGRINGLGFSGDVLGVATGSNDLSEGLAAGAGQKLWVFGLEWSADVSYDPYGSPNGVTQVTASMIFDGQQVAIPLTAPQTPSGGNAGSVDSGRQYFVASVPADAPDVVVQMSASGFDQDFSLTHMAREGTVPAPLYRTPGAWQTVDQTDTSRVLATPYQSQHADLPQAGLTIDLPQATLSYFGPEGATDPAPAGQAWLAPQLSDPYPANGNDLYYLSPLTPDELTLKVPGQAVVHPTMLPGGPDNPNVAPRMNTLFEDQFAFLVPAGTTTATLTIDPATQTVILPGSIIEDTVSVPSATFDLTFPPPATPTPPDNASATPATIQTVSAPAGSASGSNHHGGTGGSGFPTGPLVGGLLAVLAIAAVAAVVNRRRRQPRLASAAASPPGTFAGQFVPHAEPNGTQPPPGPDTTEPPPSMWRTAAAGGTSGYTPSTAHPVAAPPTASTWPAAGAEPIAVADPVTRSPYSTPDPWTADQDASVAAPGGASPDNLVPSARRQLVPVPEGPPPLSAGQSRVLILGLPGIEGLPAPIGETHQELLTFLTVHPGERFTTEQLRGRLRPARSSGDFGERTIPRYMSHLRSVYGPDRIPDNSDSGGYQARDIDSDLAAFNRSIGAAGQTADPTSRAEHLAAALSWVRGAPFQEAPKGRYGWADTDDELSSDPCNAILQASIELARLAIDHQDRKLADWATGQGLKVWPTDEALLEMVLCASALAGIAQLDAAWKRIQARLKANDTEPSDRLQAKYLSLKGLGG